MNKDRSTAELEALLKFADARINVLVDAQSAQPVPKPCQIAARERFEAYWTETRGSGRARMQLARDTLEPQVYVSDEANRHWVTYQEALRCAH